MAGGRLAGVDEVRDATLHGEVVDALPVVASGTTVEPVRSAMPVVAQAAAVAATGAMAGVLTAAMVRRGKTRRSVRKSRKHTHGLPVLASRSFLVDVHVIDPRR